MRQYFVLNPLREIFISRISSQVVEWQNGDNPSRPCLRRRDEVMPPEDARGYYGSEADKEKQTPHHGMCTKKPPSLRPPHRDGELAGGRIATCGIGLQCPLNHLRERRGQIGLPRGFWQDRAQAIVPSPFQGARRQDSRGPIVDPRITCRLLGCHVTGGSDHLRLRSSIRHLQRGRRLPRELSQCQNRRASLVRLHTQGYCRASRRDAERRWHGRPRVRAPLLEHDRDRIVPR